MRQMTMRTAEGWEWTFEGDFDGPPQEVKRPNSTEVSFSFNPQYITRIIDGPVVLLDNRVHVLTLKSLVEDKGLTLPQALDVLRRTSSVEPPP